ncbi:MAG: ribonuclease Z [Thermoplasmata archaeon]|nr:MAG: ribonuclease Z [Thermoplasmata archaeon]
MTQMQLIFLGTGGSWPTIKRNVTSIAIKRGGEVVLFDCGEGTQRQLQKSQISYMQIKKIFISHFHGDHFLGLPGLIQTMQLNDRKDPLFIYGPKGLFELMEQIINLGYFKPAYQIIVKEVESTDVIHFDSYDIEVLSVSHGVPTLAYALIEHLRPGKFNKKKALELGVPEGPLFSKLQKGTPVTLDDGTIIKPEIILGPPRLGRKIVYSGDTRYYEDMISFAENADALIHEGTFDSSLQDIAYQYGHSTAKDAAEIAKKAKVKFLFITHVSPRYLDHKELLKEAQKIFKNVIIPKDFQMETIQLPKSKNNDIE